jgi:hypothetical protein
LQKITQKPQKTNKIREKPVLFCKKSLKNRIFVAILFSAFSAFSAVKFAVRLLTITHEKCIILGFVLGRKMAEKTQIYTVLHSFNYISLCPEKFQRNFQD